MELTPDFSISINGGSTFPKERVISIRTTDEAGIISDSCEIELDDFDGALQFPNTEAKVVVSLGYKEAGLTKIGTYFVREISIDGARHIVRIQCNAASKAMRSQNTKTNNGGLKDLVNEMSSNFGLEPAFEDGLEEINLENYPQFTESDMSYLTRLAHTRSAVTKPVNGHLVFTNAANGKSVTGLQLPAKYIDAQDVSNYSCSFKETESNGGTGSVSADWYDAENARYMTVTVGSGEPVTQLKECFSSEKDAIVAANAALKRISKSNVTFRFSIAGRTDLFAESPLILRGFNPKIPTKWIMNRVEHFLSTNGFITNVDCCNGEG